MLTITNERCIGLMVSQWIKGYPDLCPEDPQVIAFPKTEEVNIGQHQKVILQPTSRTLPMILIEHLAKQATKVVVLTSGEVNHWPGLPANVDLVAIPSSPKEWLDRLK